MWQSIVHQGWCQHLTILIILKAFKQSPTETLSHTTMDLSFDSNGIDGVADILNGHIIKDAHLTRLRINGDSGKMSGEHGRGCSIGGTTTSIDRLEPTTKAH